MVFVETPGGLRVHYLLAPPNDPDFFPGPQVTNVARAIDNDAAPLPGSPSGYIAGYLGLGFLGPFNANTTIWDCNAHGDCDNGTASEFGIRLPAPNYTMATEARIRAVIGHELFHQVEYSYISTGQGSKWGKASVEGMARLMEDKVYSDLDGTSCPTVPNCGALYPGEVANYMANPNQTIWRSSYRAALWWNYLGEQLSPAAPEPNVGVDFVRRFWEFADARSDDPSTIGAARETIQSYPPDRSLRELFHDFTIANVAREWPAPSLPNSTWYRYADELGTSAKYASVARAWQGDLASQQGPTWDRVDSWGARYHHAVPTNACIGVAGYVAEGQATRQALLAVRDGNVERIHKGAGTRFASAVLMSEHASERYSDLVAVTTGLDDIADYQWVFACGLPTLDITWPTATSQAYVGEPLEPERFLVRLVVTGPPALGTPTVEGLSPEDFAVYVGPVSPTNRAPVLSGARVQGEYWLTVQAPLKSSNSTYELNVRLGSVASAVEADAVVYQKRVVDEMYVIDRSGSMLFPPESPKMVAAKNAVGLMVDVVSSDSFVGLASFGGNQVEPDDDATLNRELLPATDLQRDGVQFALGLVNPNMETYTAIGDGLEKARLEFQLRGSAERDDWIVLVSDGIETEAAYWADVETAIKSDGIRVNTIALGPESDQGLMQRIALETGGDPYFVDVGTIAGVAAATASIEPSDPLATRLADALESSWERANGNDRLWEESGPIAASSTVVHSVTVGEAGLRNARWSVNWDDGSSAVSVLVRPQGGTPLADGVGGVRVFTSSTHAALHVPTLAPGTWEIEIQAGSAPIQHAAFLSGRSIEGVRLALFFAQTPDPQVISEGGTFRWGLPMPILATLTSSSGPVLGADVNATVEHPDGSPLVLPLFDDGAHADGQADDGVYGHEYTRTTLASPTGFPEGTPPQRGSYTVAVTATGTDASSAPFTRIRKGSFHVYATVDPADDVDADGMADGYEALHVCLDPGAIDTAPDADGDTFTNGAEWNTGTDPCHPDTDRGGESDGSELARGTNPFDPRDDAIPRPLDVEVVTWILEHMENDPPLLPGRNLIRFPSEPAYQTLRVLRSLSPVGPFAQIAEFDPRTLLFYADDGLVNGTTYYYQVQGVGLSGVTSAPSPVFSGTPKTDPIPPTGHVTIDGGASHTNSTAVTLSFQVSGNPASELLVSNDASFAGASWQPYADTLPWTLAPDAFALGRVFARFRNAALAESETAHDEILLTGVALGQIDGTALLQNQSAHAGIFVVVQGMPGALPGLSDDAGDFAIPALLPGTYTLAFSARGYLPAQLASVDVPSGGIVTVGPIELLQDTDEDGIANEVDTDDDGDGLEDGVETNTGVYVGPTNTGSDPLDADSDDDGFGDGAEVAGGSNPNDPSSTPVTPQIPVLGWIARLALIAGLGAALALAARRSRATA